MNDESCGRCGELDEHPKHTHGDGFYCHVDPTICINMLHEDLRRCHDLRMDAEWKLMQEVKQLKRTIEHMTPVLEAAFLEASDAEQDEYKARTGKDWNPHELWFRICKYREWLKEEAL